MERQGFRILADLAKLPVPYQNTGVIARKSFVSAAPEIVERFIGALTEGVAFAMEPANKAAVMKSLARGLRLPRTEDALEGYEGSTSGKIFLLAPVASRLTPYSFSQKLFSALAGCMSFRITSAQSEAVMSFCQFGSALPARSVMTI